MLRHERRSAKPSVTINFRKRYHRFFTKRRKACESLRNVQDAFLRGAAVRGDGGHHVHERGARRPGRPRHAARGLPLLGRQPALRGRRHGDEVPAPPPPAPSRPRPGLAGARGRPRARARPLGGAAPRRPLGRAPPPPPARGREAAARAPPPAARGQPARLARARRLALRRGLPSAVPRREWHAAPRAPGARPARRSLAPVPARPAALPRAPPPHAPRERSQWRGRHADLGRFGGIREAIQATPYQAGLYASGRGSGARHSIWKCLFSDDNLQIRSVATKLQKYVQTEASLAKMVGGSRFHDGITDEHRQDSRARAQEEKAHQYRGIGEGSSRTTFPQAAKTVGPGDNFSGGQLAAREGGSEGLVLQQAAEGEENDAAQHAGRGHDGRDECADALWAPRHARQSPGPAFSLALAQPAHAVPSGHGRPPARRPLTVSLLGAPRQTLPLPGR